MAYQFITLAQFIADISELLDDANNKYWTVQEIQFAVYEALRYWGGLTSYWKTRGTFNIQPYQQQFSGPALPSPYVDLSVALPALRTRTYTLDQMVREIQYMLLEAPNGISGAGMSGQVSVGTILESIQDARNRFVRDVHLPLTIHSNYAPAPNQAGMVTFPQTSVFVHRATWQDIGGAWTILWRQDAWAVDKALINWTNTPGYPAMYSESENSPLQLQLIPPPIAQGTLEAITVDTLVMDLTNQNSTFNVPDEWVHAIKYSALGCVLNSGQIGDPLRVQYCDERYKQDVEMAKSATSVIRALLNGQPLPITPITDYDLGAPTWLNTWGPPYAMAALYDIVAPIPGLPDNLYGIALDVVQTAPLPQLTGYMPIGEEDIEHIEEYVRHVLQFKCGGKDFTQTMSGYDDFMSSVAGRKGVNAANIQYLTPLFQQPQGEWAMRPDRVEAPSA
jgi:hypothetical protein